MWKRLAILGIVAGTATGAERRATVDRIDGTAEIGFFRGATPSNILLESDGRDLSIPIHALRTLRWGRAETFRAPTGVPVFYFDAGGQTPGTIAADADEAVLANLDVARRQSSPARTAAPRRDAPPDPPESAVHIPFSTLSGIWLGGENPPTGARDLFDELLANRLAGQDVLITAGDGQLGSIRGGLLGLGPESGRIWHNRKERRFKLDQVVAVVFGTGVSDPRHWSAVVELATGAEMPARLLDGDAERLDIETPFAERLSLPLDGVRGVRFQSDRLVFLSDLKPAAQSVNGILLDPIEARFDRSAANRPLALDGVTYERGIGAHSPGEIAFVLGGQYETLASIIGIDDAVRPIGSVAFKVIGDGANLFDSGTMTGRDHARSIRVNVGGVDQLTIKVESADGLEIADHANWCDARLIKPPPPVQTKPKATTP
jgi:hypothetical protein